MPPPSRDLDDGIPFRCGEGGRISAPPVVIAGHAPAISEALQHHGRISHATPHVTAAVALGWSGTEETRRGLPEGILKLSANIGC